MYRVKELEAEIKVKDYLRDYVDVETFLEKCKECPNYKKIWSCPPFEFDVREYWNKYRKLKLYGIKIIFDKELRERTLSLEEQDRVLKDVVSVEKKKLSEFLWKKEEERPQSVSLSAGACSTCGEICPRSFGEKCAYPKKMRYSIEALGGNVGLTVSRLFNIELKWMEEGKLPEYFVLVSGLLEK